MNNGYSYTVTPVYKNTCSYRVGAEGTVRLSGVFERVPEPYCSRKSCQQIQEQETLQLRFLREKVSCLTKVVSVQ